MIIGIDAGSKFIKVSSEKDPHILYADHKGDPEKTIHDLFAKNVCSPSDTLVITGHYGEHLSQIFENSQRCDEVSAVIEAVRMHKLAVQYVVNVGSGSIRFITLDPDGNFQSYRENTLCAAGTGSFLDEQMERMGFTYETLKDLSFIDNPPDIASRCSVFAKSDLIHRQQEGATQEEMWNGLCNGVVHTMLHSVFKGNIPEQPVLFCGGFFKNSIVREWIKQLIPDPVFLDEGEYIVAEGAAFAGAYGVINNKAKSQVVSGKDELENKVYSLEINRSVPYKSSTYKDYVEEGNEVRLQREPKDGDAIIIGIDIGSTSTKAAVLDAESREVIIDIYRKTAGNPIEATRKIFQQLRSIYKDKQVTVVASGTTGSGRKLIGTIIGADTVVNEITAHFKGATYTDASIETIFEIGGQDAKFIRGKNGSVVDCNMNFVCAAGTGSFIEEQAHRLGFDVREIGDKVLGLNAPHTSDRCTVFMEQDINKLLRNGFSKEETLAGVIRSIVKNYLNRVVGARPITGDKVFFQGATARNKGLVAAFENITGKQIIVSPYCHVMGAYGTALIAYDAIQDQPTKFKGLEVLESKISISYVICADCANKCKIHIARFEDGQEESWGYMCGKESLQDKKKHEGIDNFTKIRVLNEKKRSTANQEEKRGVIGIPRSLTMHNYLPLWKTFFEELGFGVQVSKRSTSADKEAGISLAQSDFCFPVKMGLAHVHQLLESKKVDAIFYPTFISEKKQKNGTPRVFCPYVISFPSVAKSSLPTDIPIISPAIDFRNNISFNLEQLHQSLMALGVSKNEVKKAYKNGLKALTSFYKERYQHGQNMLKKAREEGKIVIVGIGRPYNLYDSVINLNLPEYFNENEKLVTIPYDAIIDPEDNNYDIFHNYWNYGDRILYAARKIRKMKNVYPVYFTNFSCGPDSFILTRFEKMLQGKPYLIIELDEHGSDTGYITRIEAFLDVVFDKDKKDFNHNYKDEHYNQMWRDKNRKLWIPPMHEISSRLMAAAFRAFGYQSEALPVENTESFEIGKQNVRGSECLPASATIGTFIHTLNRIQADPKEHALFMPTALGPCRFGQYLILHRNILDANGYHDTVIFSPSSTNAYMGMPGKLRAYLWDTILAGDMLLKYICKTRPYEVEKGTIDRAASEAIHTIIKGIEKNKEILPLLVQGIKKISQVPIDKTEKPLVGIVGEIYVRSNNYCNENLIRYVEAQGGEAWLTPTSEWILYTSRMEKFQSRYRIKNAAKRFLIGLKTKYMFNRHDKYEEALKEYLVDRFEPHMEEMLEVGSKYVPVFFEGETILTVARAIKFAEQDAAMVVNCSPFGCMPGNITSSILSNKTLEKNMVPVVSLFYDGESDMNRTVGIYLNNLRKDMKKKVTA